MRLVLLTEFFGKGMGYLENMLPKQLARLGVETHVVASDLPLLCRQNPLSQAYGGFSEPLRAGAVETLHGYTLHILGHRRMAGHMRLTGLHRKLRAIRPDIVQTMTNIGWVGLDAGFGKTLLGYKLFTGCHYHASVFPLAGKAGSAWSAKRLRCLATRTVPGALVSLATEKCYAIAEDCAGIAEKFFGVPRGKIEIGPLGVDTELFHVRTDPGAEANKTILRHRLGFSRKQVVCIYTGRFGEDKNPLLLARAVAELLRAGEPYRGLFVGDGPQAKQIEKCAGNLTRPFVPVEELGALYRAADIGVWPAQESLSMLDAAACGLPVVASHTMAAPERLEGNGATYRLGDRADLIRVLRALRDPEARQRLGLAGARKMAEQFSWEAIARRRVRDYEAALRISGRTVSGRAIARTTDDAVAVHPAKRGIGA
jgi:glycosyltransferase involved in cell wall biosynthesis